MMTTRAGAGPRFFQTKDLPPAPSLAALNEWSRELAATFRTVEHPFNAGLMLEALVSRARSALHSPNR
jgi:DNA polymerase III subunit delta'